MSTYFLLLEAVSCEDLGILENFIKDGQVDLNEADEDGITCVHIAAGLEDCAILECLINHGASVDEQTSEGLTPLHIAAMWGRSEQVSCLLSHGADCDLVDANGCNALMQAINSEEDGSQACIDVIVLHQENTNLSNEENRPDTCQVTPDSINFDKLEGSPWVTPRRGSKNSRNNNKTSQLRLSTKLEILGNEESHSVTEDDAPGNFEAGEYWEELLTEMSDQDSSKDSNSPNTFSYSTITCLESHKLDSLSSNECSKYLTECSTSDDEFIAEEKRINEEMRRDERRDGNMQKDKTEVKDDTTETTDEESYMYETADENVGVSLRESKQNESSDSDDEESIEERKQIRNSAESYNTKEIIEEESSQDMERGIIKKQRNCERVDDSKLAASGKPLNSTFCIESPHSVPFFIPFQNDSLKPPAMPNTNHPISNDSDETVAYDWREFSIDVRNETIACIPDSYKKMSCNELRKKMTDMHGQIPGPITPQTKMLYVKKLWKLDQGIGKRNAKDRSPCSFYPVEIRLILTGKTEIPDCNTLELDMMKEFCRSPRKVQWRGGTEKSSFNYLLLDPRVTLDLPQRSKKLSVTESFRSFILSIFYVGKGKRSRPYAHLHEAVKYATSKSNKKLDHIWDIWRDELGVISLHLFQSAIPVEAFTREACMVEALGLSQLTNQKRGEYYGMCSSLAIQKKRKLGVFFLYKAFQIFLQEGERQICREDL